ncbi:MAG: bifunctional adenosylcobinamide kinase/adenosylcobinamide-phosphate guanylyltransferase [Clostridia bacterium]|nr:bifunctional adenosylcobinamide kinase/adenosylcobinamide-phosphate guanylyltransferase [Clostridia bacterium]
MTILVTGGAASGKSEIAEKLAVELNQGRLGYFATMQATDAESLARVEKHRRMRAGKGFKTVECPLGLPEDGVLRKFDTVLLDCLSNFAANVMFSAKKDEQETAQALASELSRLFGSVKNAVVVTNEVFSDGVERYDGYTRAYIHALGVANQALAARADVMIESVCGIAVFHKGRERLLDYENFR